MAVILGHTCSIYVSLSYALPRIVYMNTFFKQVIKIIKPFFRLYETFKFDGFLVVNIKDVELVAVTFDLLQETTD